MASGRRFTRTVVQPLQAFLATESASGLLLLAGAMLALLWANGPWSTTYEQVWTTPVSLGHGSFEIGMDLRHWVNEGLMTLFFLLVGLEIKREVTTGELRDARKLALPAIAALGGMVVPAFVFIALNVSTGQGRGWAIPVATDIAFALGVLTLASPRAPAGLFSFLLTLAIIDDIGAIAVIALVYPHGISWPTLGAAAGLVVLVMGLQRLHVRASIVYVALGVALWVAVFESGVHPSIAGVTLGLLTPAVPFQRPSAVSREAHRIADRTVDEPSPPDADAKEWLLLARLSREAVSPLARVEDLLHHWTSRLIVPMFALANAGVTLSASAFAAAAGSRVAIGVVLGLVLGKTVGITLASWGAIALGLARRPRGVTNRMLVGVAAVAGVGFTVSLFVADLEFGTSGTGEAARLAILVASILAGVLGSAILRRSHG